jgi:ABC-type sugar transport system substrate-binding protein
VKKLIALAVVVLVLAGAGWFSFGADYSEGYRVGQVIKLSRSGYVFKTWEGTLDFGFLQQDPTAGVATRLWDFSVRDDDEQVRKDIDTAIAGNRKVKLHYREKYFRWSWLGDTKHFVDKVEPAG